MSPLRLFIVLNSLAPGGAERSIVELLPALAGSSIGARIVCLRDREVSLRDEVRMLGTPVTVLPSGSVLHQARALRRLIAAEQPHLIHTSIFDADVIGRLAAIGGPPVLTSLVNVSYDPSRLADPAVRRWKLALARAIEGVTARHLTDHFHAIGEEVKRSGVARLGIDPDKITVIPRGRDRARLGRRTADRRAAVRAAMHVRDDQPVVLSVGRQEYQKGQQHLIHAFERVAETRPQAVLWIAGREGAASSDLRAAVAASSAPERILLLGHRADVADLLCAADVFAFPSLYEGLGGAVLEAMALECPIVASDLAPLREYLTDGHSALLTPPGDAVALAERIDWVIDDRTLSARLTREAADAFAERFDLADVNRQMAKLYARVAQARLARRYVELVGAAERDA